MNVHHTAKHNCSGQVHFSRYLFGGLHNKGYNMLGSMLGSTLGSPIGGNYHVTLQKTLYAAAYTTAKSLWMARRVRGVYRV